MRRLIYLLLILSISLTSTAGSAAAVDNRAVNQAQNLLDELTAAERIGQLVLVTVQGSSIEEDNPILELIRNHHISGVILSAENDNFVDAPDTLVAARSLISSLQQAEYDSSLRATIIDPETQETSRPRFIPLFIGINQEGGGTPYSEILSGMTDLPSAMAIGATWDTSLAMRTGETLGYELRALGINLLLGPSLDVLDEPRLVGTGDLGVRTFGGDPFWVSVMGSAYITGLHVGAGGRMAVIAKHFPGLGGSDRDTQVEVATIRRSLDQLQQIELVPFAAVTGAAPGSDGIIDGVLTSHIRYQGFQGNIRAATRPVSFDAQALQTLLGLEPYLGWREGGGLVVSDSLGARAIRRFYDPSETTFRAHIVARDALIAGNDLLQLSQLGSGNDPTGIESIETTLAFFEQKYADDPVFAERVDEAALRVIQMKFRLHGSNFTRAGLFPSILDLENVGDGGVTTFEVARRAATLISPAQEQLLEELGEPPGTDDAIVIFTDVREVSQCSTCVPFEEIGKDDLASEILNLYGPLGTGQISDRNLTSFNMADLAAYLGEVPPIEVAESLALEYSIEVALQTSDWLVFSVFKSSDEVFGSQGLKLLLDRRPDLVRNKRVVVFVYDVPYDMDATDISKIDAYYALYSRSEEFVEVAARMLFQEIPATGASPVNVPGVGYDLIDVLTPDPGQTIALHVIYDEQETSEEATPTGFRRGDLIHVETGVIVDGNGNPVPDGTPVYFDVAYQAEGIPPVRIETITTDGVGAMSLTLDRLGTLTIQAASELARTSEILQLEIQEDAFSVVTVIPPTGTAIATIGPTGTAAESAGESGEPIDDQGGSESDLHTTNLLDLAIGLLGVVLVAGAGFLLTRRQGDEQTAIRFALFGAVFGLAGYDYLAMGLPGSERLLESSGLWSSLLVTIVAGVLGQTLWAVGWVIWQRIKSD